VEQLPIIPTRSRLSTYIQNVPRGTFPFRRNLGAPNLSTWRSGWSYHHDPPKENSKCSTWNILPGSPRLWLPYSFAKGGVSSKARSLSSHLPQNPHPGEVARALCELCSRGPATPPAPPARIISTTSPNSGFQTTPTVAHQLFHVEQLPSPKSEDHRSSPRPNCSTWNIPLPHDRKSNRLRPSHPPSFTVRIHRIFTPKIPPAKLFHVEQLLSSRKITCKSFIPRKNVPRGTFCIRRKHGYTVRHGRKPNCSTWNIPNLLR